MPDDEGAPAPEFKPIASQEELDRRVGERLARERAKYADYDDLKAKAAKFDEVEAASKTELQKLQDLVAERDGQIATLPKEARAQAIRFASKATHMGFLDPEDALVLLGDVDLADADAVEKALTELAERKPHLVRAKKPAPPGVRPKPKEGDGDTADDQAKGKERAAAALRQFRSR